MDDVMQAAMVLAVAVIAAVGRAAYAALTAWATNLVQQRIGAGAARIAGEIAARIAADPALTAATQDMIRQGAQTLEKRFPDTARRLAPDVLAGMIAGEAGKLGLAVRP